MATEEEFKKASQLTALTYMVAGCLNYSIENLNKYLDAKNLHISGPEKMLFNRIKSQISQLQSNLYTLEGMAFKVIQCANCKTYINHLDSVSTITEANREDTMST